MEDQCIIPVEIICQIFSLLTPLEIVRLRTVSKQFRDISYVPTIWRALYANARLPRPPGPFPSQSVQFLERTLIKSERLAQSWTTQPLRYGSHVRIRLGKLPMSTPKVLNGKWLVACESSRKFVVHDLDSVTVPHLQQVLWEQEIPVHEWDSATVVASEGPVLYILFSYAIKGNQFQPWKLLEFRVNTDSGSLYRSLFLDVPMKHFDQPECVDGGHGPFLHIGIQKLILDVETQQFYEIPPFSSALPVDGPPPPLFTPLELGVTLCTKTHLLYLRGVMYNAAQSLQSTLVQAFILPTGACSARSSPNFLRLSHEGVIHGLPEVVHLIRNSLVDPISGATNIRHLSPSTDPMNVHYSCIDLTLPKHSPADTNTVLPITIDTHDIFEAQDDVYRLHTRGWTCHVEFSDDGYVRGLWHRNPQSVHMDPVEDTSFLRFTIDASQERCTGVLGEPLFPEGREDEHPHLVHRSVEGVRGKLCYDGRGGWDNWDLTAVVEFE